MGRAKIEAAFNGLAADGTAAEHERLFGDLARQVIAGMEIRAGQSVIDVGCGTGWATARICKLTPGAHAVGIDVAEEMIALAQGIPGQGGRIRFERMAMEEIGFPDGSFDHAFILGSLEFTADPRRGLGEIARVLRPGGRVELVVRAHPGAGTAATWAERLGIPVFEQPMETWAGWLVAAGFEVLEQDLLVDSRVAAGIEPTFIPTVWAADEGERARQSAAGVLHLRAKKA